LRTIRAAVRRSSSRATVGRKDYTSISASGKAQMAASGESPRTYTILVGLGPAPGRNFLRSRRDPGDFLGACLIAIKQLIHRPVGPEERGGDPAIGAGPVKEHPAVLLGQVVGGVWAADVALDTAGRIAEEEVSMGVLSNLRLYSSMKAGDRLKMVSVSSLPVFTVRRTCSVSRSILLSRPRARSVRGFSHRLNGLSPRCVSIAR